MLRPYLKGTRLTIQTEHESLKCILDLSGAIGGLALWNLRLSEFDFDVVHHMGIDSQAADAPSRLQTTFVSTKHTECNLPIVVINMKAIGATKVRLEYHQHAQVQVVEANNSSMKGAAPTIAESL